MSTVFDYNQLCDVSSARGAMAESIREVWSDARSGVPGRPAQKVLRVRVALCPVDPLTWLCAQDTDTGIYWSDRDGKIDMAGIGIADQRQGLDGLSGLDVLQSDGVRYYGGMRFDDRMACDDAWAAFGPSWFVLPRFELVRRQGYTEFLCNLLPDRDDTNIDAMLRRLDEISFDLAIPLPPAAVAWNRSDTPSRSGWDEVVDRLLRRLSTGPMAKLVLARKTSYDLTDTVRADHLLLQLRARTPGCFHFCFQPSREVAFIGASPERLYARTGRRIESEAVAGTRPRGEQDQEDFRLEKELLKSDKEIREHRYVADSIRTAMGQFCAHVGGGVDILPLKLARVQHLVSRFHGYLTDGISDSQIIDGLHPTAAVGGYPTGEARQHLASLESFDRGWYAGPVGWVGLDRAEFAVAIRCGLVERSRLHLYSGAGIVEGSAAASEWDELEHKISSFLRILNGS